MRSGQSIMDKFAIGLSLACAIHCIVLPVLLVMLPSLAALQLDDEAFHIWMVAAVLPSSIYALSMGCKQHKRYRLLFIGLIGLMLLVLALALGEERIGEMGEKTLTVIGSGFIAVGHWLNYRFCHEQNYSDCECPGSAQSGPQ